MIAKTAKKQNVLMIFDDNSEPVAIVWQNGRTNYFLLKEMNITEHEELWESDTKINDHA